MKGPRLSRDPGLPLSGPVADFLGRRVRRCSSIALPMPIPFTASLRASAAVACGFDQTKTENLVVEILKHDKSSSSEKLFVYLSIFKTGNLKFRRIPGELSSRVT